jgi:hypothetical protein
MLTVTYAECHIKALYDECLYAECHYAESRGANISIEKFVRSFANTRPRVLSKNLKSGNASI